MGHKNRQPAAFCFLFPLGLENAEMCCLLLKKLFCFAGNMVLIVLWAVATWLPWAAAYGPAFLQTPPAEVLYSNNTGLILDCLARGDPPPIIDWVDANGNVLSIHPSVAR